MPVVAGAGNGERNSQFSSFMTILADERSNAIVASGTQDDLNLVRQLVKQVDVVLPQVQIDVLIASVTLSNTVQRGIDAFTGISVTANKVTGIKGVTGPGFSIADLVFNRTAGQKTTLTGTGNLSPTDTNTNVHVLSVPSITTTHNQEATITVAKAVPIITSAYSDVSSTVGARNSYSYQNIGLELTVKPLIGSDGTIQMEVEQSADEIDKYNSDNQPLISKRTAKSFVSVQDGEIIVLGGLQKDTKSKTRNGYQLLGEIPLIGFLFGNNTTTKDRDEIIFFIQPRILRTTADADRLARLELDQSTTRLMVEKRLHQTVVLPADPLVK
jgi:general secretion pathway protein D